MESSRDGRGAEGGILRPTRHAATARAGKLGQVLGVQPDDEMGQKGEDDDDDDEHPCC